MPDVVLPIEKDPKATYVLNKWYKNVGDNIRRGDTLVSYEQEKGTVDLVSEFDGVLREVYFKEGALVAPGSKICRIE